MKSTSADDVISHALWPGPGRPASFDDHVVGAAPPGARLLKYCSRSATRCSSDGPAAAGGAAGDGAGAASCAATTPPKRPAARATPTARPSVRRPTLLIPNTPFRI